MEAIYIDRNSQQTLDWLRGLIGTDGEYQKVLSANRQDFPIPPSAMLRVQIDLLIEKKDA